MLLEAVLLVGAREMRHEAQRRDRIAMREPLHQRRHLGGAHAQAVHSGVDLEEHLDRPLEMRLFEQRHLIGMMNDRREAPGRELGQLVGGEKPFEQQDPPRVVRSAQLERGVELDDREAVRVRERREHAHEAVAVGVGLDHREHLRLGRARPDLREICAQRGDVDLGKQRAGHGARAGGGLSCPIVGEGRCARTTRRQSPRGCGAPPIMV